jgi:hypothetical protein
LIELLLRKILNDHSASIQESEIVFGTDSYWQSTVLDGSNFPVGGGYHRDRYQARKIGLAEFVERMNYRRIQKNNSTQLKEKWGAHILPTACGFAAGFDKNQTVLRSVQEAVERWVMSKWIDDNYYIQEFELREIQPDLGSGSLFFINEFDKVLFFKKEVVVFLNNEPFKIEVAQTMGLKDGGIYPGSSARSIGEGIWEHALVESFRHLMGVKNNPVRVNQFPDDRIHYFSKNADKAIKQISKAYKKEWPLSQVKHFNVEEIMNGEMFLARTIIDGWRSWHEGKIDRFLY